MSTTESAGAVVPASAPLSVTQVISGLEPKIDALVEAQLAEFEKDIADVASSAAFLVPVTDNATAEDAADAYKKATRLGKELDESRKTLTRRLDALKDRMKGPFDKKITICTGAAARHKENARPYLEEKDRKAEADRLAALEVRRKAEEQAAREREEARLEREKADREAAEAKRREDDARAETERLEHEREQAKTKKAREDADAKLAQARLAQTQAEEDAAAKEEAVVEAANEEAIATEVAAAVSTPVNVKSQSAGVRSTSGASLGMVKHWQHRVVDESLLPDEAWSINHDWIAAQYANEEARRKIADANGVPQIAGCYIFRGSKVGGR